jgi:hypothetical protein
MAVVVILALRVEKRRGGGVGGARAERRGVKGGWGSAFKAQARTSGGQGERWTIG